MTTIVTHADKSRSIAGIISAGFAAVGKVLLVIGESSRFARELEKLNRTSDEALAARGLTRDEAIRRIIGANGHI